MTDPKKPKCPAGLGKHGKAFWARIASEYELLPQDEDRLYGACVALDRAHAAREILDRDGLCFEDRFGQLRESPAVKIEASSWNSFRLLLRELGIDSPPTDTRPATAPRGYR